MSKQHLAVPMLEDVYTSVDALALRCPTIISGIECQVLLPAPARSWEAGGARQPARPRRRGLSSFPGSPQPRAAVRGGRPGGGRT
jgi:hypothetical protein